MIDRARLKELKQEIGEDDFAEVAAIFLDEMEEVLQGLGDDPAAATPADFHGLRGSALNLGFIDLAKACSNAETRAKGGEPVDIVRLFWLFRESVKSCGEDLPQLAA